MSSLNPQNGKHCPHLNFVLAMARLYRFAPVFVLALLLVGGTAPNNDSSASRSLERDGPPEPIPNTQRTLSDGAPRQDPPFQTVPATDSTAVAVVELFTSQGCSSCPPADRLLRSLVKTARAENRPVYALSFHVDYWNQLGWEDPYSDAAYSQRQRRYSQALDVDTYTPQIVVNGQRAMVGSRAGQVRSAIESALADPARIGVDLQIEGDDELTVTHRLTGPLPENTRLRLAVVERGLSKDVTRGENAGRTLQHANVVRSFTTVPARGEGTTSLPLPDAVDRTQASVIGYVQAPSWTVLGATRVDLSETSPSAAR